MRSNMVSQNYTASSFETHQRLLTILHYQVLQLTNYASISYNPG